MNRIIFIALFLVLFRCQFTGTAVCDCADLKSEIDCTNYTFSKSCIWNLEKKNCSVYVDPITPTPPTTKATTSLYCAKFLQADCAKTEGCAWVNQSCSHFTGCTPFKISTLEGCQAISLQCISDGIHCVQLGKCSSYTQEQACNNNQTYQICYWDEVSKSCGDANTCEKLPKTYTTDLVCRRQIKTCTTNGQGCIISENTCNDQKTELSCFWDFNKNKACFWDMTRTDSNNCQEKICENAPTSYTQYQDCFNFLQICTVRNDLKGCRTKTQCEDSIIEEGCKYDYSNKQCYWRSDISKCLLLECQAAPPTYDSNKKCEDFAPNQNCITKLGGGCQTNGSCSVAQSQDACKMNINKQTCFWDTSVTPSTCKELICENLPITINSASDCSSNLSTCTLNLYTNKGCIPKTCDNAPSYTTDCETYLPKNNCIKNKAGGCNTLTICSSITIYTACTQDVNKNNCYWNPDTSACVDLKCENLAISLTKHEECNSKLNTCTNKSGGGCQTQQCENSATQSLCNTNTCKWKGGICFEKSCSLARKSTFSDCNAYLDSCTFNLDKNATTGCAYIPLRCDAILNEEACKKKKEIDFEGIIKYKDCGWDGQKCIDAGCTTLSKSYTTTAECQTNGYQFINCVSANPDQAGNVEGCIVLPDSCADRKSYDNCEKIYSVTGALCIWNNDNSKCENKSCATASLVGSTGSLTTFTNVNCAAYLEGCIVNNTVDGCMAKPTSCSGLSSQNCFDDSKQTGDCIWKEDNYMCVDKTCNNLSFTNHSDCYYKDSKLYRKCTVNVAGDGCQALKSQCFEYATENSCFVNSAGDNCIFDGIQCRSATCADARLTSEFDTHDECNAHASKCTVSNYVNTCQPKAVNCSDYLIKEACVQTITGINCIWGGKTCYDKSTFDCTKIFVYGTYDNAKCEGIYYKCTNDSTTCKLKTCNQYTTVNGLATAILVQTQFDCKSLDSNCSISQEGQCQTTLHLCSYYDESYDKKCTFAEEGECVWNDEAKSCAKAGLSCSSYKGSTDTVCGSQRDFCKAGVNANTATVCEIKGCSAFTGSAGDLDQDRCKAKDPSCTVNNDGSACVDVKSCENYGTNETYCTFNTQGKKCFWDNSPYIPTCITLSGSTCTKITGKTDLTRADCQAYSTTCTVNRAATACVEIKSTCVGVDIADCQESSTQLCVQNQANDTGATCANFTTGTACNLIYVKSGTYTHDICNKLNSTCTNNSNTACAAKTCANAATQTSYKDCNDWLNTCTWDVNTSCVAIKATCAEQYKTKCYRSKEGECSVINDLCVKLECTQIFAPVDYTACDSYSSTCTIAPIGGCQALSSSCSSYKTSISCVKSTNADCYWNQTNKNCVDLACSNIEQTAPFNTQDKCYSIVNYNTSKIKIIYCTVRSNEDNTAPAFGCQDLQSSCTSYKIREQCFNDKNGKQCEWVTPADNQSSCVYKTCTTALIFYHTYYDCKSYYSDQNVSCTVNAIKNADGTITIGGCMQTTKCSSYIHEIQCELSDKYEVCGWNGTSCEIKSCTTADPQKYTDHYQCQGYFYNQCTVSDTDAGCIDLPETCEELKTKNNCQINKKGINCYWDDTKSICLTPTCENAPQIFFDNQTCSIYKSNCTQDSEIQCQHLVCEDYIEKTDEQCKMKISTNYCTTDGIKCVKRGTCKQALSQAACTFDRQLQLCEWDYNNKYCSDMNCLTAPIELFTTDLQCSNYYIPKKCMFNIGGGCTNRTNCSNIKLQEICINDIGDINGQLCSWDNGSCRNQNCTDFTGTTHTECQNKYIKGQCTLGQNQKCVAVTSCDKTSIQEACVFGTDGPCLWINGKCYLYKKCESIQFNTDIECKAISNYCTVNTLLNKCVPITSCSESNVNGGCVTGYDGECIISQDTNGKVCKLKTSCADATFTTYNDCQIANQGCTTDGITCIELADCQTYKSEAGCIRNKKGASDTVTGLCHWDTVAKTCHDQKCSEIYTGIFATHSICQSYSKKCTSNGSQCVDLTKCDQYVIEEISCNSARGSDLLPCFYEAEQVSKHRKASCRTKQCSDIVDTTQCEMDELQCISDGSKCIPKGTCSSYTTKVACNAGGTDGVCVFKPGESALGTCSKMTSCESASQDQHACQHPLMINTCQWKTTISDNFKATACTGYSCAAYYAYSKRCIGFKVFGGATQQICTLTQSGYCVESDPNSLTYNTCFTSSNYVFTWNEQTNSCQYCKGKSTDQNNNSGNNSNDTTTSYGLILGLVGFASILF